MAGQRGNPISMYDYAGSNEVLRKYVGTSPLISRVAIPQLLGPVQRLVRLHGGEGGFLDGLGQGQGHTCRGCVCPCGKA